MDWSQVIGPAILAIGGVLGWVVRSRVEMASLAKQKLNDDRRATYKSIIAPYVDLLIGLKDKKGASKALASLQSREYKGGLFDLVFFGSDEVVRAHNALFSHLYSQGTASTGQERVGEFLKLWGGLLLAIRRDVGNKSTGLDEIDMLRWLIRDIDRLE